VNFVTHLSIFVKGHDARLHIFKV